MKMPKAYFVKRDEKNPIWKEFISEHPVVGNRRYKYHGNDKHGFRKGTGSDNIDSFGGYELITLEEWKKIKSFNPVFRFSKMYGVDPKYVLAIHKYVVDKAEVKGILFSILTDNIPEDQTDLSAEEFMKLYSFINSEVPEEIRGSLEKVSNHLKS